MGLGGVGERSRRKAKVRRHLGTAAPPGGTDVAGPGSRGQAWVPRALPKGEAPPLRHPTRRGARPADGLPAEGAAGVWRTQARPRDKAGGDKGAANTCRSWRGRRFSPPKRLQLPTVTGIKLRGPDGGPREPGGGGGAGRRDGSEDPGRVGRGENQGAEGPHGAEGEGELRQGPKERRAFGGDEGLGGTEMTARKEAAAGAGWRTRGRRAGAGGGRTRRAWRCRRGRGRCPAGAPASRHRHA